MTTKPTPDELAQLGLDPIEGQYDGWSGDRRSEDWRIKLAKRRGTARTRQLAMDFFRPAQQRHKGE